jgi:hypothetical protein
MRLAPGRNTVEVSQSGSGRQDESIRTFGDHPRESVSQPSAINHHISGQLAETPQEITQHRNGAG